MKPLLPFALVLLATPALAQPTIGPDNMPQVGDIVPIGLCSDAVSATALNASAGAMQTWDFSGLSETSEEAFTFVDPASTPWAYAYPNANLCGISWTGSHSYYIASATSLDAEGNSQILPGPAPEDTFKVVTASNTERLLALPYTFGASYTDAFAGSFSVGGFAGTVDGTINFEADGYGTLILPNGTYTDVVRYHVTRVQHNTVLAQTTTINKEQWAWLSEDHRFWLLLMEINDDGIGITDLTWYNKAPALAGPSGVDETSVPGWSVSPNPADAGALINLLMPAHVQFARIELLDATGRAVRSYRSWQSNLSTEGLLPGAYVLQLTGRDGASLGSHRILLR